jgi:hypothetical protein
MNTLVERSQELRKEIDRYANQEGDAQIAQNLSGIADAVSNHATQAQALATSVRVIAAERLLEGQWISAQAVASLQKRIEAVRKRLSETRGDPRKGNLWANCDADAKALAKTVGSQAESAWRRFLDKQSTDTTNFSTFRRVPACGSVLKRVDEANATLKARTLSLPTTRKEITEANATGEHAKELIGKLKLDGVPREIQTLLKNAATGGVPLTELTDDMLKWLRENQDFLDGVRINSSSR